MRESLKAIVESLLFVSGERLTPRRMQEVLELREPSILREILAELAEDYERRGGGFYLDEVAGGFQLRTRPEYRDYIRRLLSAGGARLSKAALETLAIVAYRQPVMRSDIDHVRGVDSGGVLRALLERKLIRVLGRKEIPGRPLIYGTTRQFLEVFGLRDLKDLPTLKEIAAMGEADADDGDAPVAADAAEASENEATTADGKNDAAESWNGENGKSATETGEPAFPPPAASTGAAEDGAETEISEPAAEAGHVGSAPPANGEEDENPEPESPGRDLGENGAAEDSPGGEPDGKNA